MGKQSTSNNTTKKKQTIKQKKKNEVIEITEQDLEKQAKKQHDQSVKKQQELNKKRNSKGDVRCDKLPGRFSKGNKKWPIVTGYKNVNCCSGASGIFKELSPMKLGPYEYEHGSEKCTITNLENLWQFSKVFPGEEEQVRNDNGQLTKVPNSEFFERRTKGWKDEKAHRHVKREKPLYSWWKGEKFNYMQARRKIYCPLYAEKVVETEAYKKLEEMVNSGMNIQILGFDGYNYDGKTLKECFEDTSKPFGHELVLCCLLKNQRVWE
ncbi:predicted protein [Naegleria gruberi]|uniref:Predicted protein n=1 Tax=Naegleria gruberi TaxID=5762 RepID=D2V4D6_NAEGR|nr:uncharacterized protein NAEGRDRAFT_46602 [Naegleria gruberi]EFC48496.1 predicted protein [Naegleria gruberi]|eukprot:XP_002681240.1 predicted protein [Naegleria gruberi strain NEG-M]